MKRVEQVIESSPWRAELARLRAVLAREDLVETVKWGMPCYTVDGRNVVGLGGFKHHFALWFFDGARLEDDAKVLVNAQEGRTKSLRQWRMRSAEDIRPALIKRYVKQAIAVARSGETSKPRRAGRVVVPAELASALRRNRAAAKRFDAMRPGRRKEYSDYIAEAKRPETKQRRVEKILPMIIAGAGLNDPYR